MQNYPACKSLTHQFQKEDPIGIISAKFGQNPASFLRGGVL